jgi:hypothetical protein
LCNSAQHSKTAKTLPQDHQTRAISDISGNSWSATRPRLCARGRCSRRKDAAGILVIRCSANQDMLDAVKGTVRRTREERRIVASELGKRHVSYAVIFPAVEQPQHKPTGRSENSAVAVLRKVSGSPLFTFRSRYPCRMGSRFFSLSWRSPRPKPGAEEQMQDIRTCVAAAEPTDIRAIISGPCHRAPSLWAIYQNTTS